MNRSPKSKSAAGSKNPARRCAKTSPWSLWRAKKRPSNSPLPKPGTMGQVLKEKGETAKVGEVIAYLGKTARRLPHPELTQPKAPSHSAKTWTPGRSQTRRSHASCPRRKSPWTNITCDQSKSKAPAPEGRIRKEDVLRAARPTATDRTSAGSRFSHRTAPAPAARTGRCRARGGSRADEQVAPHRRGTARRSAAQRGSAHHVQRDRYGSRDGAAQGARRSVSATIPGEAGVHVVFCEGLH